MPEPEELIIYLKMVTDAADQADARQHQRFRQRMKETATEQVNLEKQAQKEITAELEANIRARNDRFKQSIRQRYNDWKQQRDQNATDERREREFNLQESVRIQKRIEQQAIESAKRTTQSVLASDISYADAKAAVMARADKGISRQRKQTSEEYLEIMRREQTEAVNLRNAMQQKMSQMGRREMEETIAQGRAETREQTRKANEQNRLMINASHDRYSEMKKNSDKTIEAYKKEEQGILNIARAYTALRIASEVSQGIHAAMRAMADSTTQVRDHVKEIVDEMERLRTRTVEILAMRGQAATGQNAAQVLREGKFSGMSADRWLKFKEESMAGIQQYIEPPGVAEKDKAMYPLTPKMGTDLEAWTALQAAAYGIDEKSAAQLERVAVSISPKGKGGKIDMDKYKDIFVKIVGSMQLSQGRTSPLMKQVAEYLAINFHEGDKLEDILRYTTRVRVAAQFNPEAAFVYSDAVDRAMRQIRANEEKSYELGIEPTMTKDQAIQQMRKAIHEQAVADAPKGATAATIRGIEEDKTQKYLGEARAYRGLDVYIEKGIKGGLFARAEKETAEMTVAKSEAWAAQFLKGPEGASQVLGIETAAERSANASEYQQLRLMEKQAYLTVLQMRLLEDRTGLGEQLGTQALSSLGFGDKEKQVIRRQLLSDFRAKVDRSILRRYDKEKPYSWNEMIFNPLAGAATAPETIFGGRTGVNWLRRRAGMLPTTTPGHRIDESTTEKELMEMLAEDTQVKSEFQVVNPTASWRGGVPAATQGMHAAAAAPRPGIDMPDRNGDIFGPNRAEREKIDALKAIKKNTEQRGPVVPGVLNNMGR